MHRREFFHLLARWGFPGWNHHTCSTADQSATEGLPGGPGCWMFAEVPISRALQALKLGWACLCSQRWCVASALLWTFGNNGSFFLPSCITNRSHMNAWRGEHGSFLSARGFPIVWNKLLLRYKSLLVGMLLGLDSSFLALQIWDRIMGTCDCASLWFLLPPFCSRVFHRRRRWAVAKESAVWGERDIIFWNACFPESPFCWCGWTAAKWCLLCLSKERLSLS